MAGWLDEDAVNHVAFILLTGWHKTKMRETAQVQRARRALQRCEDEQHTVDEEES